MLAPAPRPYPSSGSVPRSLMALLVLFALLALLPFQLTRVQPLVPTAPPPAAAPVAAPDFGKLPLSFVPNAGQTDPAVRFQVRGMGGTIFFTESEVVLALPQGSEQPNRPDPLARLDPLAPLEDSAPRPVSVVRMQFVDANPAPAIAGAAQLPGIVNYFIGNDPAQWRTNLPTYAGIVYEGIYDGIDLRYDGAEGQLKGTYVVAPGADPAQIAWRYAGAEGVSVDVQTGDLRIQLPDGATLSEQAPVAWQTVDGERVTVSAGYAVGSDGLVSFALGSYDPAHPLVIDPTLVYSTYLGGSGDDWGEGIAVDSEGNAYVTGYTTSTNFPTRSPLQPTFGGALNAFVTKLNPDGSALVYSTFLGGSSGDWGEGIAVDGTGNAYVTGYTSSTNFPTRSPLQPTFGGGDYDAFVTKLNPDGSALIYSTYLGGGYWDGGHGIAVDGTGNAYVTGFTRSTNFPTQNPLQPTFGGGYDDAFVTKLNPDGSALVYSTFLGGSDSDWGHGIAVDGAGNAYVTGSTISTNFPTRSPLQPTFGGDAFVAKLNPDGSALIYSTYLGGGNYDRGEGIAVDGAGNAYVTGYTYSSDFPTRSPLQPTLGGALNAFVTKLNPDGSALVYSTYLGGSDGNWGEGIAVDGAGNAYVTGYTYSSDFPTRSPLQPTFGGDYDDAFVTKLNAAGSALVYSTFLGGSSDDWGSGIAVDGAGNAYVTGRTSSTNFPTRSPLQPTLGGTVDAFVAKIGDVVGADIDVAIIVHGWQGGEFRIDKFNCTPTAFTAPTNPETVTEDYDRVGQLLLDQGYEVYLANWTTSAYRTIRAEDAAHDCLSPQIASVAGRDSDGKVLLVAHSMGGLVSRAYIEGNDYDNNVEALVTLGSPHVGVTLGSLIKIATLLNPKTSFVKGTICFINPGLCQLGSDEMRLFNLAHQPQNEVPYLFVGGSGGPVYMVFLNLTEGRNDGIVGFRSATGYSYDRRSSIPYIGRPLRDDILIVKGSNIARRYSDSSHSSSFPWAQHPWYFDDERVETCVGDFIQTRSPGACSDMRDPVLNALPTQSATNQGGFTPMRSGVIRTGGTETTTLDIDGSYVDILLGSSNGQLSLNLTAPDGTLITAANVSQVIPGAQYYGPTDPGDPPTIAYSLPNPPAGRWTATIAATDVATETTYALFAALESPLTINIDRPTSVASGQSFTISATMSDGTTPIDGATIVASLPTESGAQEISLTRTAPGLYTGQLTAPTSAGPHILTVTATGNAGAPFARQTDEMITVRADGVQRQGDVTVAPIDQDGNGLYETLRVSANYVATTAGDYAAMAALQSASGQVITLAQSRATWTEGVNTITFDFDGSEILSGGVDGPYQVVAQIVAAEDSRLVVDEQPLIDGLNFPASSFEGSPMSVYLPLIRR